MLIVYINKNLRRGFYFQTHIMKSKLFVLALLSIFISCKAQLIGALNNLKNVPLI